jgi:hypothetical protein
MAQSNGRTTPWLRLLCCAFLLLPACTRVDPSVKPLVGTWKEVSRIRTQGDPKIDADYEKQFTSPREPLSRPVYDAYFVITARASTLSIAYSTTDHPVDEPCDSVSVEGNTLSFRKPVDAKTDNRYRLRLVLPDQLEGEMKSWNGNTYAVGYTKMPAGFKIEKRERRF